MEEENHVQQVTMKDPKKVEAGKRLAEYNRRKRKEKKSEVNQYYGTGAVLAVVVIGGLGYYLYQAKKGELPPQQSSHTQPNNPPQQPRPQVNKFKME